MNMENLGTKPFSQELHRQYEKGEINRHAVSTLQRLKEKLELKHHLFRAQEEQELERYKQLYPEAWEQVENLEAFQNLTPLQQKEVMYEILNNGMKRPKNPVIHHL